jgi:hypothetical protein
MLIVIANDACSIHDARAFRFMIFSSGLFARPPNKPRKIGYPLVRT